MYKSAIIINPEMPTGLLANAVACITSGLFLDGQEYVGPEVEGDGIKYIQITKIPILVLKPGNNTLIDLCKKAQATGLKYMAFTYEAQSTTNYEEYTNRVKGRKLEEVNIIGLGIVGEEKQVNSIAGNLPMLK